MASNGRASIPGNPSALAALLHRHATASRDRLDALRAELAAEDAARAAIAEELGTLSSELTMYECWASGELHDGEAYRVSRAIVEERDRRLLLEQEVAALRERLAAIGNSVNHLVVARQERDTAVVGSAADAALVLTAHIKQIGA